MNQAAWSIWLLNQGEPPMLYVRNLTEEDAREWCSIAARKVFDGSDADAFILVRSDKHPSEYNT